MIWDRDSINGKEIIQIGQKSAYIKASEKFETREVYVSLALLKGTNEELLGH